MPPWCGPAGKGGTADTARPGKTSETASAWCEAGAGYTLRDIMQEHTRRVEDREATGLELAHFVLFLAGNAVPSPRHRL